MDANNSSATVGSEFFHGLFENRPSKISGVALASCLTVITVLATSGIIWFERFGSDLRRIFINTMVSSVCWSILGWFVFIQIPDITMYFYRPFPEVFCFVHLILRNIIVSQILLFFDAIIVVRYILIFCLKNPLSFHDDFWYRFVNIWVVFYSSITQFIFVFLPGRQPLNYYLCSNQLKLSDVESPTFKLNWQLTALQIVSLVLNIFVNVKIKLYKVKQRQSVAVVTNVDVIKMVENPKKVDSLNIDNLNKVYNLNKVDNLKKVDNRIKLDISKIDNRKKVDISNIDNRKKVDISNIDNRAISDFITNVISVVATSSFGITTTLINWCDSSKFNEFPYYYLVYFLHFVVPFLITGTITLLYYIRHLPLRRSLYRELKSYRAFHGLGQA